MAGKTQYKNKFVSDNYDRIFLTVPKGMKTTIEQRAKANGQSINGYISSLINKDLNIPNTTNKSSKKEMEIFLF